MEYPIIVRVDPRLLTESETWIGERKPGLWMESEHGNQDYPSTATCSPLFSGLLSSF